MLMLNKVQGGRDFTNIQKEKTKKIRGQADISLVYKNVMLGAEIYSFNSCFFFKVLMEKMYNLASFLK